MNRLGIGLLDLLVVAALLAIVAFEFGAFSDRAPPAGPRLPVGAPVAEVTPEDSRHSYPFADPAGIALVARINRGVVGGPPRRPGYTAGTGFLVDPGEERQTAEGAAPAESVWLTARHVTEGCHRLQLEGTGRLLDAPVHHVQAHPSFDAAAFWAQAGGDPLTVVDGQLPPGVPAAGIGYPQGAAGVVEVRYLGPAVYRRNAADFLLPERQHDVWMAVHYPRHVGFGGSLGGISGGPLVLADGGVVGIVIAEVPRRGQIITVPIAVASGGAASVEAEPTGRAALPVPDADALFTTLLSSGRVREVLCETI
ncbi:MAG: hypothetical protein KDA49_00180 [Rhodospirillaceae bacterium]|nr:hypothetical protein [Rhodospirillaceae bacterium]MCA8930850.1 hypothetical protein [Rhodospirillaceae bacterium]